jgi:nucleoside-diphosphate-sugar epimerase
MNGNDTRTALVLGANGGIGGEVARQLLATGWKVAALTRTPGTQARTAGIDWIVGDALNAADVYAAARGCELIVHAVSPPGYRDWDRLVLPMLRNTLAAAQAEGALVVLPGNVYNYDPDTTPVIAEDAPQRPVTRKGAIRMHMEEALRDHAAEGGRVLIVRAGDFFGPQTHNNWFAQGLVKPGRVPARIANPGQAGVGHQWSYVPDVAATMVALIERRAQLEPYASFHMAGHWDPDGSAMPEALRRVLARHGKNARIVPFPWWLVRIAAPFVATMREVLEMRYLWRQPLRMDNRKLLAVLGAEPHTPLDMAVEQTLKGLNCLPAPLPRAGSVKAA